VEPEGFVELDPQWVVMDFVREKPAALDGKGVAAVVDV
jgi:hypothetical protein